MGTMPAPRCMAPQQPDHYSSCPVVTIRQRYRFGGVLPPRPGSLRRVGPVSACAGGIPPGSGRDGFGRGISGRFRIVPLHPGSSPVRFFPQNCLSRSGPEPCFIRRGGTVIYVKNEVKSLLRCDPRIHEACQRRGSLCEKRVKPGSPAFSLRPPGGFTLPPDRASRPRKKAAPASPRRRCRRHPARSAAEKPSPRPGFPRRTGRRSPPDNIPGYTAGSAGFSPRPRWIPVRSTGSAVGRDGSGVTASTLPGQAGSGVGVRLISRTAFPMVGTIWPIRKQSQGDQSTASTISPGNGLRISHLDLPLISS